MPLIPLDLPAGVYKNGTDLQGAGRWINSSLVRWTEGTMRPVGGWDTFENVDTTGTPRGAIAWRDNNGQRNLAVGTAAALSYVSTSGTITDITPAALVAGSVDGMSNSGFGGGNYGLGSYGTPRTPSLSITPPTVWSLDTFGQNLIALSPADGRVHLWDLNPLNKAAPIVGAPTDARAVIVTEERFLMVLGAGGDSRNVAWSDQADYTVWTAAATNQAGDQNLQTSGALMAGRKVRGQTLLLSDVDAHIASYIGAPFVFDLQRVGTNCGLIAAGAHASMNGGAIWMGRRGFFAYNGGAVEAVPCDVSDYVFGRLNQVQAGKVMAVSHADQNEIWFFYPSGQENDSYVVYNYQEQHWAIGSMARTAGVAAGVYDRLLMFDATGKLWRHEVAFNYQGDPLPFAETGPLQIGNGDQVAHVMAMIPDERTEGDVQARFKTKFYPNAPETVHGPYQMSAPTDVRFAARQAQLRVEGLPDRPSGWRIGQMRLEIKQGGKR